MGNLNPACVGAYWDISYVEVASQNEGSFSESSMWGFYSLGVCIGALLFMEAPLRGDIIAPSLGFRVYG